MGTVIACSTGAAGEQRTFALIGLAPFCAVLAAGFRSAANPHCEVL